MKNFLEHIIGEVKILTERIVDGKGNKELDIRARWQMADQININNRRYRKEILEREIKKINEKIAKGESIWGMAYHPSDEFGRPSDISHKWTKVWMLADGSCLGDLTLLNTVNGKDMQVLVKAGRIGISSRGRGTVTEKEEIIGGKMKKFSDVNSDFSLISPGDFVVSPSVSSAYAGTSEALQHLEGQLNEAGNFPGEIKHEDTMIKFNEGLVEELMKMNHSRDVDTGFSGSFEEWKKKGEAITRASILVADGTVQSIEQGLRLLSEHLLADQIAHRPERQKVSAKDVIWEARMAGCDPVKLAEKINKSIEQAEQLENRTDISVQVARNLLKEAMKAGADIGNPEVRAKVLEGAKVNQQKEPLSLDEEALARVEILRKQGIIEDVSFVKKVILAEKEAKRKEAERLKKVEKTQRLVSEATRAGASSADIKKIIGE